MSDASTNANKAYVYALQSKNGSVLWQDEIPVSSSSAIIQNGIIYLNGSLNQASGGVYALRSNDGSLPWSYPLSGTTFTAPILVDTTLYISAANAIDLRTASQQRYPHIAPPCRCRQMNLPLIRQEKNSLI